MLIPLTLFWNEIFVREKLKLLNFLSYFVVIILFWYGKFCNHLSTYVVVVVILFLAMQMANFASGTGNLQNSTGKTKVFTWARFTERCFSVCPVLFCLILERRVTEDITWPHGAEIRNFSGVLKNVPQVSAANELNIFQHEKIIFVFPSGHVMFCLLYKHQ